MNVEPTIERLDEFSAPLLPRCTFPAFGTPVVCAFSGGPDSTALLALAVAAGCEVHAVHIDHGLRPSSATDAALAEQNANNLGVTFRCEEVTLPSGANLEARARHARRSILGADAMTGHTADDQAETALLALIRGSGATGIAAMAPGPTKPILRLRRFETHQLCRQLGVTVAVDPTNADPRFRRNRIRNEVLPLLDEIAERDITPLLNRTSELLRDDDAQLNEFAADLDPTDARALTAAPRPMARRAVRRWLTVEGYPPDAAAVGRVLAVAGGDAVGCEIAGHRRIERSQQRLRIISITPQKPVPNESDSH